MSENVDVNTYIPSSTKDLYQKNLNNNFSFIYKNFLEGKLRIYDHNTPHYYQHTASPISDTRSREKPFSNESFEHLREIIRVINEVFQDRWNLEVTLTPHGTLNIIGFSVYFSNIRLTNNRNEEHILRDSYAFIPLFSPNTNSKTLYLGPMFLGRSTQTVVEHERYYSHSHQRDYRVTDIRGMENYGIPNNFFSDMCLGNSDDGILRALRIFNSSPTSDNLVAVLMNIISTIRYESLEGGPYKKIADYFYNSSSNNNNSTFNLSVLNASNIKYLSELLLKNALKNDENLTLKFDVKAHPFLRKEIEFHDDLKLEEILIDSYKNLVEAANSSNDVIKIVNGENKGVQANLSLINKLFYQDATSTRRVYFNLDRYYADRRTTRDPNKNNEDEVIKIGSYPIFYFRGNPVYSKIINPKKENQEPVDIKNANLKLTPHYFNLIKSNLTNKILQNVLEQTS